MLRISLLWWGVFKQNNTKPIKITNKSFKPAYFRKILQFTCNSYVRNEYRQISWCQLLSCCYCPTFCLLIVLSVHVFARSCKISSLWNLANFIHKVYLVLYIPVLYNSLCYCSLSYQCMRAMSTGDMGSGSGKVSECIATHETLLFYSHMTK